jgi:tripartite-type tricarboxylate transporter receptor subunit TctC
MNWKMIAACVAMMAAPLAGAEAWPAKPIKLLIPLAAGGATDKAARLMAARLGAALGQQVVAENVTGASGAIALQRLAQSEPDGYTLGATANSLHTVAPHMAKLPYDPVTAFTFAGTYAAFDYVLVVGASSPVNSVQDLLARARQSPGEVSYGSSGVGTGNHLAGALLGQLASVEFNSIPYRGGSPAMLDVIAGRTGFMFDVVGGAMSLIEGGKVKALGVSGVKRQPLLPQVPPIADAVPGYESGGWFALIGPAKLPPAIVQRLNTELNKIQASAEFREQLTALGYQPLPGTPSDVEKRLRTESVKWGQVVARLPCALVPERCAQPSPK